METKINPWLGIISFIVPIVGIVLFFVKLEDDSEIAKKYLGWAIFGILISFILALASI